MTQDTILTHQQQNLVLLWRSLNDSVLEVTVVAGLPEFTKTTLMDFKQKMEVVPYALTDEEFLILRTAEAIGFGKLVILVKDGRPALSETSSTINIKLSEIPRVQND